MVSVNLPKYETALEAVKAIAPLYGNVCRIEEAFQEAMGYTLDRAVLNILLRAK